MVELGEAGVEAVPLIALLEPLPLLQEPSSVSISHGKGEWSVAERTTFMEYLCNESS